MSAKTWLSTMWRISRTGIGYLLIFLLSSAIFSLVGWQASFMDPDSFFHARMAELMLEQGIVRDFPWLPLTTLGQAFADHHFLYHIALLPFVAVFGGLLGTKIASVVLVSAAVTAFYAALRSYGVRFPWLFAGLLMTSGSFIFRAGLGKATALAMVLVFLSLIAWRQNRPVWLFILSWLFVWTHGGWPLMLVLVAVFMAARLIASATWPRSWREKFWTWARQPAHGAWQGFASWPETRALGATLGGLVAGLIINPFFPNNLRFYWEQIVQIAFLNYSRHIGVGAEWYPFTLRELVDNAGMTFVVIAAAVGCLLVAVYWSRQPLGDGSLEENRAAAQRLLAIAIMALGCFLMTLRNRRHVEYFTPFAIFLAALLFALAWPYLVSLYRQVRDGAKRWPQVLVGVLLAYAVIYFPLMAARDIWVMRLVNQSKGIVWTKYERAAAWLTQNVAPGEMVLTSDWDDFPPLFYRASEFKYVMGLDPTFLYRSDPHQYQHYVNITTGKRRYEAVKTCRVVFGARVAFVENDHVGMMQALEADARAIKAYGDDEVTIFWLK